MSLDLDRLENVVDRGDLIEARCPICKSRGSDKTGNHLAIFKNGRRQGPYGCAIGCDTKEIFAAVGVKSRRKARKIQDQLTGRFRLPRFKQWATEDWETWKRQHFLELADEARELLPIILKDFAWPQAEALRESAALPETQTEHWQTFLHAFYPDDVLAFHHESQTGPQIFATAREWSQRCPKAPPADYDPSLPHEKCFRDLTYGVTWARGSQTRDANNRREDRYTIVEIDKDPRTGLDMPLSDQAAVHRYCREALEMDLRMLIFSGRASLHGLYASDSIDDRWTSLKIHLCGVGVGGLGVDPGPFTRSTTRTPGAIRNPDAKTDSMKLQSILWLDPSWPAWS
jgi:hypothetical protein